MRLLFFSDIHGVPKALEKILEHAQVLQPDRFVILGDLLYHGPRNGVPTGYDPQRVAELLNTQQQMILAVRGNCDSEVDQMMLKFTILADFSEILTESRHFFLTHGHLWHEQNLPPLPSTTTFVQGHTHVPMIKKVSSSLTIFNPGSISLPKENWTPSFGFFNGEKLSIRHLATGEILLEE